MLKLAFVSLSGCEDFIQISYLIGILTLIFFGALAHSFIYKELSRSTGYWSLEILL